MRAAAALAGSVLLALSLVGCDSDVNGSPTTRTAIVITPAATVPTLTARPPARGTVSTEPRDPAALRALAGNWRAEEGGVRFDALVDAKTGDATIAKGGDEMNAGYVVTLGQGHYRIEILTSHGGRTPQVTVDLSADGKTMTMHSSDEPGPVIFHRVG